MYLGTVCPLMVNNSAVEENALQKQVSWSYCSPLSPAFLGSPALRLHTWVHKPFLGSIGIKVSLTFIFAHNQKSRQSPMQPTYIIILDSQLLPTRQKHLRVDQIRIVLQVRTLQWTDRSCQLSTWGIFLFPSHQSTRASQPVPAWGQCMYWAYLCWLSPISWQYPSHHSMGRVMRSDRCALHTKSPLPLLSQPPFPTAQATQPDSYQYWFQQSCREMAE